MDKIVSFTHLVMGAWRWADSVFVGLVQAYDLPGSKFYTGAVWQLWFRSFNEVLPVGGCVGIANAGSTPASPCDCGAESFAGKIASISIQLVKISNLHPQYLGERLTLFDHPDSVIDVRIVRSAPPWRQSPTNEPQNGFLERFGVTGDFCREVAAEAHSEVVCNCF